MCVCLWPNSLTIMAMCVGQERRYRPSWTLQDTACKGLLATSESGYISMSMDRFVHVLLALSRAVHTLHAAGWLHRDIRASNVLVDCGTGLVGSTCCFQGYPPPHTHPSLCVCVYVCVCVCVRVCVCVCVCGYKRCVARDTSACLKKFKYECVSRTVYACLVCGEIYNYVCVWSMGTRERERKRERERERARKRGYS